MKYTVKLTRQARRDLERLPERIQGWAMQTIDSLAVNPRPPSWKRLQGGLGYSIRHGDYRLVYDIQDDVLVVIVVSVAHRRDVYRQ